MEQQQYQVQRQVGRVDDLSNRLVDQCRPGLSFEEDGIPLIQRWVQVLEDGGKVNGLVFNAYMVTVNGDGTCREPQQTGEPPVSR